MLLEKHTKANIKSIVSKLFQKLNKADQNPQSPLLDKYNIQEHIVFTKQNVHSLKRPGVQQ